jgi:serine/threonine-protein kinase
MPFTITPAPPPSGREGTVLMDRYRVISKLGEGGMGTVYIAEHLAIRKRFAIKVLSHEFAHKTDLVERFLQEARAASMIAQENVVEITDFGNTPDGSVFFVMEHLQGEDLANLIKREGRLSWDRAKPIALQICSALQAAHEAGIIHRDMKPENCFRISRHGNEDFIKVLDFGIAKITGPDAEGAGKGLTRTGMIFGTPEYMAPEQAQGLRPDFRVDIYAMGVIMYEMLTGRVPFIADTFMAVLTKHMFEPPRPPSQLCPDAGIPAEVEAIVMKALEKDPANRFQSMAEMAMAIDSVGTGAIVLEPRARDHSAKIVLSSSWPDPGSGLLTPTAVPGGTSPLLVERGATQRPASQPPVMANYDGHQQKGSALKWGAIGVASLAALGVVGFLFVQQNQAVAVDPGKSAQIATEQAAPAKTNVETPVAAPENEDQKTQAPVEPPARPKIHLTLDVEPKGVTVIRVEDGRVLGDTTQSDELLLDYSETPVKVRLEAEGYEPLELSLDLTSDAKYARKLEAKPSVADTSRGKKPRWKTKNDETRTSKDPGTSANEREEDPPEDKPAVDTQKTPSVTSPDLKDPFKRRG